MNPQELWQSQSTSTKIPPGDELARRAKDFDRTIRRRNVREYRASAIVLLAMIYPAGWGPGLATRVASVIVMVSVVVAMVRLHRNGTPGAPRADVPTRDALRLLRAELEKQRALLASVWLWYLAPILASVALFVLADAHDRGHGVSTVTPVLAFWALVGAVIAWLNHRGARKLAREIAALETPSDGA